MMKQSALVLISRLAICSRCPSSPKDSWKLSKNPFLQSYCYYANIPHTTRPFASLCYYGHGSSKLPPIRLSDGRFTGQRDTGWFWYGGERAKHLVIVQWKAVPVYVYWCNQWIWVLVPKISQLVYFPTSLQKQHLSTRQKQPGASHKGQQGATTIPPELFKHICNSADGQSHSFRLVNRYWERCTTSLIFEELDLKSSAERVRQLWTFKKDPACRFAEYVKFIKWGSIPKYDGTSKFPWLHLLVSINPWHIKSVVRDPRLEEHFEDTVTEFFRIMGPFCSAPDTHLIRIVGPFDRGRQTIRSVHFALPRSPPSSFSRGIKLLQLNKLHFRRFEDLTHLACELPDLEILYCRSLVFGSVPATVLSRRRPRSSRNELKELTLSECSFDAKETSAYMIAIISLFLYTHDIPSFLPQDEIDAFVALARAVRCSLDYLTVRYDVQPEDGCRTLEFRDRTSSILGLRSGSLAHHNDTATTTFGLAMIYATKTPQEWRAFDHLLGNLRQPSQLVLGFELWEEAHEFPAIVSKYVPYLSRAEAVRYSISKQTSKNPTVLGSLVFGFPRRWYQVLLDTYEFRGKAQDRITDVYT